MDPMYAWSHYQNWVEDTSYLKHSGVCDSDANCHNRDKLQGLNEEKRLSEGWGLVIIALRNAGKMFINGILNHTPDF